MEEIEENSKIHWLAQGHMPQLGIEPRQWSETSRNQWQRLGPHGHQGRPSVVRDIVISGNALDHSATNQDRPSVVRDIVISGNALDH